MLAAGGYNFRLTSLWCKHLIRARSSPVSSQEAQAGGADFVIEYDHGQDPAVVGAACERDVPPLLVGIE